MSRRFQFSLRAMMLMVTVAAVCCSVWTWLPGAAKAAAMVAVIVGLPLAAIEAACAWLGSQPDQNPKLITADMLARLGDVPMTTMNKLICRGLLKPVKSHRSAGPLFDPQSPEVVEWLRAMRGKWPLD